MKTNAENLSALARRVAESESKLQNLEWEIEEIGQPAAHQLKRRLGALKIEESALKRNLSEALGMSEPNEERTAKIEALLNYIQSEQASVAEDADFLHQSGHTTGEFAAQAGGLLVDLIRGAVKRVFGDHHPLGKSVFVNHNREELKTYYGLEAPENEEPKT